MLDLRPVATEQLFSGSEGTTGSGRRTDVQSLKPHDSLSGDAPDLRQSG